MECFDMLAVQTEDPVVFAAQHNQADFQQQQTPARTGHFALRRDRDGVGSSAHGQGVQTQIRQCKGLFELMMEREWIAGNGKPRVVDPQEGQRRWKHRKT